MEQAITESEAVGTTKPQHHPAWLQHEINKAHHRKQQAEQHNQDQQRIHQHVAQHSHKTRQRIRATRPAQPSAMPAITYIDNQRPATSTPHGRPATSQTQRERPKWALTGEEEEAAMEAECAELVGYVEELDFDCWVAGVEERAEEAEQTSGDSEDTQHETDQPTLTDTLGNATEVKVVGEWDDTQPRPPTGVRPKTQSALPRPHTAEARPHTARPSTSPPAATDGTEALVATLLHSSPAIRNIHSSHSLRALIASAHGGRGVHHTAAATVNSVSVPIPSPLVSVVATRETMHGKINPSLLPYLHRHPAV